jgi:hypothetical protein
MREDDDGEAGEELQADEREGLAGLILEKESANLEACLAMVRVFAISLIFGGL